MSFLCANVFARRQRCFHWSKRKESKCGVVKIAENQQRYLSSVSKVSACRSPVATKINYISIRAVSIRSNFSQCKSEAKEKWFGATWKKDFCCWWPTCSALSRLYFVWCKNCRKSEIYMDTNRPEVNCEYDMHSNWFLTVSIRSLQVSVQCHCISNCSVTHRWCCTITVTAIRCSRTWNIRCCWFRNTFWFCSCWSTSASWISERLHMAVATLSSFYCSPIKFFRNFC